MADTQTYNHNDIQRYLQHKMSPQEMHAFEKALMSDPFLADALDGFLPADANLTEKHLAEIESSITGQKEKAKVVPMPLQKKAWWKVAAIVFFIAAGGAFFYSLVTTSDNEKNIAHQETPPKAAEKVMITDSIGPVEKPVAQVDISPKKILFDKHRSPIIADTKEAPIAMQSTRLKGNSLQADALAKKEEDVALLRRSSEVSRLSAPQVSADTKREMTAGKMVTPLPQTEHEFKGKVLDERGQPVPGAEIIINDNDTAAFADASGNFTLKSNNDSMSVSVTAPGFLLSDINIRSGLSENRIVLSNNGLSLSEVVVTPLKRLRIKHNEAEAIPKKGWMNFKNYVRRETNNFRANIPNYNKQEIELEFSINDRGKPGNIKVSQQADKLLAEKAIKILLNGPKWKSKKKDKTIKIVIPF